MQAILAALLLGGFGVFLLWKGLRGDVIKTMDGKVIIPRWVYVLGGLVTLILPVAYVVVLLQID